MLADNEIRICTERSLPDDLKIKAADIAIKENPLNQPVVQLSPDWNGPQLSNLDLSFELPPRFVPVIMVLQSVESVKLLARLRQESSQGCLPLYRPPL